MAKFVKYKDDRDFSKYISYRYTNLKKEIERVIADKIINQGLTVTVNNVQPDNAGNITLVKSDIGLGNVDNTSDLNKPISTTTQTALNLKQNILIGMDEFVSDRILQLTDSGKILFMNSASPLQVIVPTQANVAHPIGTQIIINRLSTGTVQVVPQSGVTIASVDNNTFLASQYSAATLIKASPILWILIGDLSS